MAILAVVPFVGAWIETNKRNYIRAQIPTELEEKKYDKARKKLADRIGCGICARCACGLTC